MIRYDSVLEKHSYIVLCSYFNWYKFIYYLAPINVPEELETIQDFRTSVLHLFDCYFVYYNIYVI